MVPKGGPRLSSTQLIIKLLQLGFEIYEVGYPLVKSAEGVYRAVTAEGLKSPSEVMKNYFTPDYSIPPTCRATNAYLTLSCSEKACHVAMKAFLVPAAEWKEFVKDAKVVGEFDVGASVPQYCKRLAPGTASFVGLPLDKSERLYLVYFIDTNFSVKANLNGLKLAPSANWKYTTLVNAGLRSATFEKQRELWGW